MGGASGSSSDQSNSFSQTPYGPMDQVFRAGADILFPMWGQQAGGMQQNQADTLGGMWGVGQQANPAQLNQLGGGATMANQGQTALTSQGQGGMGYDQGLMAQYQQGLNAGPSAESQINASIMGGAGNNYADAMKNQLQGDANYAMNNMMNVVDTRMSRGDMSGSSRGDILQGVGAQDINENLQRNLTDVGYKTFDQDLNRKLGIAQRADTNQAANMRGLEQMMAGGMNQGNIAQQNAVANSLGYGDQRNTAQQFGLGNVGNQQNQVMATNQPYFAQGDMANQFLSSLTGAQPTMMSQGTGSGSSSSKGASAGGK